MMLTRPGPGSVTDYNMFDNVHYVNLVRFGT